MHVLTSLPYWSDGVDVQGNDDFFGENEFGSEVVGSLLHDDGFGVLEAEPLDCVPGLSKNAGSSSISLRSRRSDKLLKGFCVRQ